MEAARRASTPSATPPETPVVRRRQGAAAGLPCLLAAVLTASEAGAWPSALMECLARDARRLLPPSLAVLMREREREIREEAERLPADLTRVLDADLVAGRLQAETLASLETRTTEALELLRRQRVSEGVIRLGSLYRIPAELSDPVLSVGRGGYPPGVAREYYAFIEASLDKIPVVLDEPPALRFRRRDLPGYWQSVLGRSRSQSGVIGTELFQNGRVVDHRSLDYRSPVFGVASLAYSRAVTSIAATWLAIWREVHGDVSRMPAPRQVLPRDDAGVVRSPTPAPPPRSERP